MTDPAPRAAEITRLFFQEIPRVRALLKSDMEAAYAGDPSAQSREEIVLSYPGLEAIAIQRSAHILFGAGVPLIPRMMTEWAHSRTGIDIHPGARIGSHFFIDHGTGVVIGETCVIGDRVKLYHGVTLGARSTIGANVLLMNSIPADTLLVRGEQVQSRLDKRQKKPKEGKDPITVQINQDELDFII